MKLAYVPGTGTQVTRMSEKSPVAHFNTQESTLYGVQMFVRHVICKVMWEQVEHAQKSPCHEKMPQILASKL